MPYTTLMVFHKHHPNGFYRPPSLRTIMGRPPTTPIGTRRALVQLGCKYLFARFNFHQLCSGTFHLPGLFFTNPLLLAYPSMCLAGAPDQCTELAKSYNLIPRCDSTDRKTAGCSSNRSSMGHGCVCSWRNMTSAACLHIIKVHFTPQTQPQA